MLSNWFVFNSLKKSHFHYWKAVSFSVPNLFLSGDLNGVSHIGRYCHNNAFSTNISGADCYSPGIHVDLVLFECSCAKAVLFAPIWPRSAPVSIWLLALGSIPAPVTLLLSLDLMLFFLVSLALTLGFPWRILACLWTGSSSEYPEYDDFLRICFSGSNELDQGCLDWPEDSANAKEYWEMGVFMRVLLGVLNSWRIISLTAFSYSWGKVESVSQNRGLKLQEKHHLKFLVNNTRGLSTSLSTLIIIRDDFPFLPLRRKCKQPKPQRVILEHIHSIWGQFSNRHSRRHD